MTGLYTFMVPAGIQRTEDIIALGDGKYIDFKFDARTPMKEVKTILLQTP